MRLIAAVAFGLLLAACGSSPTAPTAAPVPAPSPAPAPLTATVSLTDTVSGASLGSSTQTVATFPAVLTFTAPGHVPRQAVIRSPTATVDLIPEAGFDLGFYRQLVRNGFEAPGSIEPLRRLTVAPSIYLQTAGLTAAVVESYRNFANVAVHEFSGHTMGVMAFETGDALRPDRAGWITVELFSDAATSYCGNALVGVSAGHVRLNLGRTDCTRPPGHTLAHEIGHAMGFWHVADLQSLMSNTRPLSHNGVPSAAERYHAAIAYKRPPGNRDVDVDPVNAVLSAPRVVVD